MFQREFITIRFARRSISLGFNKGKVVAISLNTMAAIDLSMKERRWRKLSRRVTSVLLALLYLWHSDCHYILECDRIIEFAIKSR